MTDKLFKDPIYGYITIPSDFCASFIDTPEFQRLRRVSQTGYEPLYPSALHNRFVHSLGVYHLGCIAADSLDNSVQDLLKNDEDREYWKSAVSVFKLACLLHDFGHSPFSHAGEDFYLLANDHLVRDLVEQVSNESFSLDVNGTAMSGNAAPHEIMSALFSLERFGKKIEHPALFARCITGYRHLTPLDLKDYLDNILIETLHSSTIDVDRLDYLIRDAFVVGYDSIAIDYQRLLKSLRVVCYGDKYIRCFHKSALSVLENVIYARDLEKHWIQGHPVVLYEQALVQHLISAVNNRESKKDNELFSQRALASEGIEINSGTTVRLMSDDDIVFLAKQTYDEDELIKEYFDRTFRRHPVWKSGAEYRTIFDVRLSDKERPSVEQMKSVMADFIKLYGERNQFALLNQDAVDKLNDELEQLNMSEIAGRQQGKERKATLKKQLKLLGALKRYSTDSGVPFDYAVLSIKNFSSGFTEGEIGDERITFSDGISASCNKLSNVLNLLSAQTEEGSTFFLFYRRTPSGSMDKEKFTSCLKKIF